VVLSAARCESKLAFKFVSDSSVLRLGIHQPRQNLPSATGVPNTIGPDPFNASIGDALGGGLLPAKLREQIALTVSQANGCSYCVAAHCAIGKTVGLSNSELNDARQSSSPDTKVDTALGFARRLVEDRGRVTEESLARVRRAGYGDAEITEMVAIVAWKIFSNYFHHVAGTDIDFPAVEGSTAA